ncbi:hypothetical protein [Haladaptatus halobius]|nr:hypothetical protein [Haladaptatus halobius]
MSDQSTENSYTGLWWKQFRELVIKCVVHNLELSLAISHEEGDCP